MNPHGSWSHLLPAALAFLTTACSPSSFASNSSAAAVSGDEDGGRSSIFVGPPPAVQQDDAASQNPFDADGAPAAADPDAGAPEVGSDAVACAAGHAACAGACVDLASDAQNCGACGHVCSPGACSGGACEPWELNSTASGPFASDGTALVWPAILSNGVEPLEVAVDGSASTAIALGPLSTDTIIDVAIAGPFVYWTSCDGSSTTLWQGREGHPGSAASVVTVAGRGQGLAVDSSAAYAYFHTLVGTTAILHRCDVAGATGTCTILTTFSSTQPGRIGVDDTAVYWTDPGNGLVSRYALADGTASTLASGQRNPVAIALDANEVYWIASIVNDAGGDGFAVNAGSKSGGSARVIATGQSPATALATDGTNVYVGTDAVVESVPIAGGTPVTLSTATPTPIDFTYAAGALYWASAEAPGVYEIRVP
jgi:hypothetical protein